MRFFSEVLTYCVILQAFICYCSSSDVYDVRTCERVCVLFIGIVQRNGACLTWKSAIEIKSLLLLLVFNHQEETRSSTASMLMSQVQCSDFSPHKTGTARQALSSSAFPAISLGFTIIGDILCKRSVFKSNHRGSHIPSSWMVCDGCVFVTGVQ